VREKDFSIITSNVLVNVCSVDSSRPQLDANISVELENADLWQRFCSLGNEMILTK
jgi:hypothetical protein